MIDRDRADSGFFPSLAEQSGMTFATMLRDRESLVGTWVALNDPAVAEISAGLEFDAVVIDGEHSVNSIETITEMARAVDAADVDGDSDLDDRPPRRTIRRRSSASSMPA